MKKILLGALTFCLLNTANAQAKMYDKAVFKLPTIPNCDKCKDQIEFFISKEDGVTAIKVDLKRKTATVSWIIDRIAKEEIKSRISLLGFDCEDVEADEFAYKRLPPCCKKPVETPKPTTPGKQ